MIGKGNLVPDTLYVCSTLGTPDRFNHGLCVGLCAVCHPGRVHAGELPLLAHALSGAQVLEWDCAQGLMIVL